jgi:hypothetical protein
MDLPICYAVRVGGTAWDQATVGAPTQGQWADNGDGTITLGSPPLGFDVRCDAVQGGWTVASLITIMVAEAGAHLTIDQDAMNALTLLVPHYQSYWTSTTPVNRLSAFDDITLSAGCWWSCNAIGEITAGAIQLPDNVATLIVAGGPADGVLGGAPMFDAGLAANEPAADQGVMTLALNTIQPLAWRIRCGYERNWVPETNFAPAVLQTVQAFQREPAIVSEPHYENDAALTIEPRAVDVPLLLGMSLDPASAVAVQTRLANAWGDNRAVYDCTVQIRPEFVTLYTTALVEYMFVRGAFRVTSAIRSIGGGPSTLQLWGTIGPLPTPPS